ncbi:MAG: thiamine pyrophosphate-binding protein [Gemmatimonas sp.]
MSGEKLPRAEATSERAAIDRRKFLKGVAATGAAVGLSAPVSAAPLPASGLARETSKARGPSVTQIAAEQDTPPDVAPLTTKKTGSDFMVDVVKTLGIEYMASCPGSTFRALQESFINYGGNTKPEWLTCLHEEASVGMAHGYAKAAGKPMAAMVHGTVGLQHASMALYNAWCDRVPIMLFSGNAGATEERRPGVEWAHSVQDNAAIVRDFTKWDDYPWSLQHFAESTVRAYVLATTPPMGPVVITADGPLQEGALSSHEEEKLTIPKLARNRAPVGDPNAVREAAKLLVAAESPVILADRYGRSAEAMGLLVQLAELVQAPVVDTKGRMNFPNRHPLCQSERRGALMSQADVILALEPVDLFGLKNRVTDQLERSWRTTTKDSAKIVTIGVHDLLVHANFQDFQRYSDAEIPIVGDPVATMPMLIEYVRQELNDGRKSALESRRKKLDDAYKGLIVRARAEAAQSWEASPIGTARMWMELWNQIKNEDWALVSETSSSGNWPHRLWDMNKPWHFNGGSGGSGVGYTCVASVGAALAHRDAGRISVSVNGDGDLNMSPGVLWTAAHHKIPLLMLVHNNRCYHQEIMHLQRMANRHNRGVENARIGTEIRNPDVDYAKIAQGYGVHSSGPITDPKDLGPAIQKAVAVVKRGEPALIDVVTQPR